MRVACRVLFLATTLIVVVNVAPADRRVYPPKCALVSAVERLKASKAVFIGPVVEIQESEGIQVVKFNVSKSWKYVRASEVVVINYVHHEGPYFHRGKSYLVFANLRDGRLATGGCSGTVDVENVRYEINELDKWQGRNKSQRRPKS